MTLKDFEPGQEVYALEEIRTGSKTDYETHRRVVRTVGRKYVKAGIEGSGVVDEFFQRDESRNYLVENKNWRRPMLLFSTEEGLTEYVEKERLKTWIEEHILWSSLEEYSTEQLREVKKILEAKRK